MDRAELTHLFTRLGAPDPADWADSQIDEGLPQLATFLFLKQAWSNVIRDGEVGWIDEGLAWPVDRAGGALPDALRRLLASNADKADITTIVRIMQWRLLFDICHLIDSGEVDDPIPGYVSWGLFQVDEEGNPISPIAGIHESVLATDPTGREMKG